MNKNIYYNGNQNLKASGVKIPYTADQVDEFIKCSKDPIYFIENYVKVVSLDSGVVNFKLYPMPENEYNKVIEILNNYLKHYGN